MKRLHNIIALILCVGLAISLSNARAQTDQALDFSISVSKTTFALGEPVVVLATLKNTGDKAIDVVPIFDPKYQYAQYTIINSDGEKMLFQAEFYAEIAAYTIPLEAGKSISDFAPVFYGSSGITFSQPGRYKIIGTFSGIESKPVTLSVTAPRNDAEEMASRLMMKDQVALFILVDGAETLTDARADLHQISKDYPATVYGDYANTSLGAYYSKSGRDFKNNTLRPPDYQKADSLLSVVADKPMQTYFRVKNYSNIIKTRSTLDRKENAREYLEKLDAEIQKSGLTNRKLLDDARKNVDQ